MRGTPLPDPDPKRQQIGAKGEQSGHDEDESDSDPIIRRLRPRRSRGDAESEGFSSSRKGSDGIEIDCKVQ